MSSDKKKKDPSKNEKAQDKPIKENPKSIYHLYVSTPKRGKDSQQIINELTAYKGLIQAIYPSHKVELLNPLTTVNKIITPASAIYTIGENLQLMSDADVIVFAPEWECDDICLIEHQAAHMHQYANIIKLIKSNATVFAHNQISID